MMKLNRRSIFFPLLLAFMIGDGGPSANALNPIFFANNFRIPPPVFIQSASNSSGGGSLNAVTVTLGANATVNNEVILVGQVRNSSLGVSSIVGLGATWVQVSSKSNGTTHLVEIWKGKCLTAGNSITVTWGTTDSVAAVAMEFSNLTDVTDVAAAGSTGNTNNPATGNVGPTTVANGVVVGTAIISTYLTLSSGPTNSFTNVENLQFGGNPDKLTGVAGYRIVTGTGTYSTDWTMSGANNWTATGAAIKGN